MGAAGVEVKVGRRLESDCLSRERKCKSRDLASARDRDLNLMAKGKKEVKKEVNISKSVHLGREYKQYVSFSNDAAGVRL